MATYDASLAETTAISSSTLPPGSYYDVFSTVPEGGGGPSIIYRMSGFDTNGAVNDWVYWDATEADADASEYTGSAGPVTNVRIQKVLGG